MPAVECRDLVIRYGQHTAVDGVSFDADGGEVVAVLGPNGAGKTSTIETLEGYRAAAGGHVRVLGLDPRTDHRALVARLGVMLQRGGVYPMLGPQAVLRLFASYYEHPEPPDRLLDLVGLGGVAGTPYRHLSGGEQQRLSLALALVGRPEVVFLDEPTAGVDPEGRITVRAVVGALRERGACVALTTHELAEAERLADQMVVMAGGRIVATGTAAELAARHGGTPALRFSSTPGLDLPALAAALGRPVLEEGPGAYRVEATAAAAVTAALARWLEDHGAPLLELRSTASLEETYLTLVGRDGHDGHEEPAAPGRGRRGR